MEVNELVPPLRDWVLRLKHASATIQANVRDALATRYDPSEFVKRSEDAIWSLIGESNDWLNHLERAKAMLGDQSSHTSQVGRRLKSRGMRRT